MDVVTQKVKLEKNSRRETQVFERALVNYSIFRIYRIIDKYSDAL